MKAWIALVSLVASLMFARAASAEPIRILIAVSHARGADGELPLLHATEDGDRVRDVFTSLGGVSSAIRVVDPTRASIDGAIEKARAIAASHPANEVTFVFYFSGHGDRDRIHLGSDTLAMADLTERVRRIPAALRILVTDACRNEPTRVKGFATEPAFAVTEQGPPADGVVWLSASEAGEAAQESDELRGALFTYFWVSGLRGAADADQDGRVTLAESYDYAYAQTLLRSARGSGVLQHPTAVYALHELAPIVLTQTFGEATRIAFPQAADTRFLVYALGSRAVLGEIWSRPERRVSLAVPPGRYIVHRIGSGGPAAAEIGVGRGEERALSQSDFRAMPQEQMAQKGGEVVVHPNELALSVSGSTSRIADGAFVGALRYTYRFDEWAIGAGPRGSLGSATTPASNVKVWSVGAGATLERRWRLLDGGLVLSLGGGAAADVAWQRVERRDAAIVALAGYPTTALYRAFAAGPVAVARLRVPFGTLIFLEANVRGEALVGDFDDSPGILWSASAGVGIGASF